MVDLSNLTDELFATKIAVVENNTPNESWKILVVDDDQDVFQTTKLVLDKRKFENRPFELIYADSARAAKKMIEIESDIAVILLDVVMETDSAGLDFAEWFRKEHKNNYARIAIRTGQPGQAPEESVILDYEIDDYLSKSELTATRLITTVVTAIRGFHSLQNLEKVRMGLNRVINASSNLTSRTAMHDFSTGVLEQVSAILQINTRKLLFLQFKGKTELIASVNQQENSNLEIGEQQVNDTVASIVENTFIKKDFSQFDGVATTFISGVKEKSYVLYIETNQKLDPISSDMLELFCQRISIGFANVEFFEKLENSHQGTISLIADLLEYRDDMTGDHVLRVAKISKAIATVLKKNGHYIDTLDDDYIYILGFGSMLHDVGKIAIPDKILHKPGKLDAQEWEIMKSHSSIGGSILEQASGRSGGNEMLKIGAEIARAHHEKWDGSGYPSSLQGNDIPLSARISTVSDVYDALMNKRHYKEPWCQSDTVAYLKEQSGKHFDPVIIDAALEVLTWNDNTLDKFGIKFNGMQK